MRKNEIREIKRVVGSSSQECTFPYSHQIKSYNANSRVGHKGSLCCLLKSSLEKRLA